MNQELLPCVDTFRLLELAAIFESCIPFLPPTGQKNIAKAVEEMRTELTRPTAQAVAVDDAEVLARRFHAEYERMAPQFGYETRTETRDFDPASPNGRLMIAVCRSLQAAMGGDGK